jgi:hypothetical protein
MLGACERCKRTDTLHVVPGTSLREPYYCEACVKVVLAERNESGALAERERIERLIRGSR